MGVIKINGESKTRGEVAQLKANCVLNVWVERGACKISHTRASFNKLNQSLLLGFAAEAHSCCCRIGSRLCSCSRRVVLAAFTRGVHAWLHLHRFPFKTRVSNRSRLLIFLTCNFAGREQTVRALVRVCRSNLRLGPCARLLLVSLNHIIVTRLWKKNWLLTFCIWLLRGSRHRLV